MHPHPLGTATTWVASRQADFPVFSPHNMEGLMCEKRERVKLATARTRRKWRGSQAGERFIGDPGKKKKDRKNGKRGGRVNLAPARPRRKWRVSQSDVRFSGHPVNKNVHSNYAKWGG